ncbi:hypothetical protein MP228_002660 [Amoeboaphelidium protococcarum]|nr:hypothetical protein MP228_002660 [Amoeboaphelidium protococcarum]
MSARILNGGRLGWFGQRTATLDWCEENYMVSFYIAEFWNTLSNMAIVDLALLGLYLTYIYRFQIRYYWAYVSLVIVGIGSWAFHMTLIYEMQLLDELPMLYCVSFLLFCSVQIDRKPRYGAWFPICIALYALVVTVSYLFLKFPEFHHTAYGLFTVFVMYEAVRLSWVEKYKKHRNLLYFGLFCYIAAFTLWNIDNLACDYIRSLRNYINAQLPKVLIKYIQKLTGLNLRNGLVEIVITTCLWLSSGVLQLHAWWHILSGLGSYCSMLFLQYCSATNGLFDRPSSSGNVKDNQSVYQIVQYGADQSKQAAIYVQWKLNVLPILYCVEVNSDMDTNASENGKKQK